MIYNPIFEEEQERQAELKGLKDVIRARVTKDQVFDLGKKLFDFGKAHPIALAATIASVVGFSLGGNKK